MIILGALSFCGPSMSDAISGLVRLPVHFFFFVRFTLSDSSLGDLPRVEEDSQLPISPTSPPLSDMPPLPSSRLSEVPSSTGSVSRHPASSPPSASLSPVRATT